MAYRTKLDGTTRDVFDIGLNKGVLDFSALTTQRTLKFPDSNGVSGYVLSTDGAGNLSWAAGGGGSTSPAGADTQIQFNNAGAFGASSSLLWNSSSELHINDVYFTPYLASAGIGYGSTLKALSGNALAGFHTGSVRVEGGDHIPGSGPSAYGGYITAGRGNAVNLLGDDTQFGGSIYAGAGSIDVPASGTWAPYSQSGLVSFSAGQGGAYTGRVVFQTFAGQTTSGNITLTAGVIDGYATPSTAGGNIVFNANATSDGIGGAIQFNIGAGYATEALAITQFGELRVNTSVGTAGQVLTSSGAGVAPSWSTPSGGAAAGSNTNIQFNNAGAFGASADLTWDDTTKTFAIETSGAVNSVLQMGLSTLTAYPSGTFRFDLGRAFSAYTGAGTYDTRAGGSVTFVTGATTNAGDTAAGALIDASGGEVYATYATTGGVYLSAGLLTGTHSGGYIAPAFISAAGQTYDYGTSTYTGGGDVVLMAATKVVNANELRVTEAGITIYGAIGLGLAPDFGTSGQVLTSAGTGTTPTWTTPAAAPFTGTRVGTASVTTGTTSVNVSGYDTINLSMGANTTLNLSGGTDGLRLVLNFTQDGTGSRLLTLGTMFQFGTDITSFTLSTAAGTTDKLGVIYNATSGKFQVVAYSKGF